MKNNKNNIIEKALQSNFRNRPTTEIPEQWRAELREKLYDQASIESLEEEVLFIKYENRFWHMAWISFAASIFIFISLIYLFNRENYSLKQTVTRGIYEYLTMEHEL